MPEEQAPSEARAAAAALPEHISQNVAEIVELQEREIRTVGRAQRWLERISVFASRPVYVVGLLVGVSVWITVNVLHARHGGRPFDPPPFPWLQGLLTLVALLTATVVLIGQGRQNRLSEQRAHLDLQINLLTEQKVTKLIHLVEELRQDLPMVEDRVDPHVSALKKQTDPAQVLAALKERDRTRERPSEP